MMQAANKKEEVLRIDAEEEFEEEKGGKETRNKNGKRKRLESNQIGKDSQKEVWYAGSVAFWASSLNSCSSLCRSQL